MKKTKDGQQKQTIWEPTLIARRLILIVVTTFIRSPLMKLYPVGFFLILFIFHDYETKPFADKRLNFIQSISISILVIMAFMNTFWALSINIDIVDSIEYFMFGKCLLILELILLLLPFIWALFGLLFKLCRYLYKSCLRKVD